MTDDLKSRLRSVGGVRHDGATRWYINPDGPEAADRIEKLELIEKAYQQNQQTWSRNIARIEKLEAALREIKELHHGPEDEDVSVIDSIFIRDDRTYKIVCDTLKGKEDE